MNSSRIRLLCAGIIAGSFTALSAGTPAVPPWGAYLGYVDSSIQPGADFFAYSNGLWLKTATIPADRQYAGADLEVDQANEQHLREIVATLMSSAEADLSPEQHKLRDLYAAFEDTEHIESLGLSPVQAALERIGALKSHAEIAQFMGEPSSLVDGPFAVAFETNLKNTDAYAVTFSQSGLGMPDRDYYLLKDSASSTARHAYRQYLADILSFAGVNDPARSAAVYALELRMARAHWTAEARRDVEKTYNPMQVSALEKFAPQFPWQAYLEAAGISRRSAKGERLLIVHEKSAFPKLAAIFASTPISVWRDYLYVRFLHTRAHLLPKRVDDTDFAFYGSIVDGQKQQLPRDLRGIHLLDAQMGEALGKLYVARFFPPQAKARIRELVDNLLKAYAADIGTLAWMSEATRQQALEKLRHTTVLVGYPDHWRDYSALEIRAGDLVADVTNAQVFDWQRQLHRLDEPLDRLEWEMTPQTNNAYNEETLNEIVFPAGILQPPYFDPEADDAVNYGSIGATIGHEISHGFDSEGSKHDASGRLRNWWTAADRAKFDARTAALAEQYSRYEPLPGLHLNGKLTLTENIADLAGLVIAHKAYVLSLGGGEAPLLDGLSGDQRFYLAYGQSFREIWTEGLTRHVVLSDPHSPDNFRVNGVVRNDDGWYRAFPQIGAGDRYYLAPAERVRLW
ncbi:MAG: M13 family metallopeptidase [Steroidobacteraceae bacterium]|jgi:putative endopeptidase